MIDKQTKITVTMDSGETTEYLVSYAQAYKDKINVTLKKIDNAFIVNPNEKVTITNKDGVSRTYMVEHLVESREFSTGNLISHFKLRN